MNVCSPNLHASFGIFCFKLVTIVRDKVSHSGSIIAIFRFPFAQANVFEVLTTRKVLKNKHNIISSYFQISLSTLVTLHNKYLRSKDVKNILERYALMREMIKVSHSFITDNSADFTMYIFFIISHKCFSGCHDKEG